MASALLWPAPVLGQTTALFFDSQPGDSIGDGERTTIPAGVADFTVEQASQNRVWLSVIGPNNAFWWYLRFSVREGDTLVPGSYSGARRAGFSRFIGLEIFGNGSGCDDITGHFDVKEIGFGPTGLLDRFAVDFEQHCDDTTPALFGALRYNSTISDLTPFGGHYPTISMTVTPSLHGTVTGDGIECSVGVANCSVSLSGAAQVALRATPDPGYQLLTWEGDCHGGELTIVNVNGPKSCTAVFDTDLATAPRSLLVFDSQTADWVGQGAQERYGPTTGAFTVYTYDNAHTLQFSISGSDNSWQYAMFRAPGDYTNRLMPGDYPDARSALSGYSTSAGLDFWGNGRSCGGTVGRFVILESVYGSDGNIERFAADFEQHCGQGEPALFGAIRYNSAVGGILPFGGQYSAFRLRLFRADHAVVTGGGLLCGTYFTRCSFNNGTPSTVTLTATPQEGYAFVGWTGDCSGTAPITTISVDAANKLCGTTLVARAKLVGWFSSATSVRFGTPVTWLATASPTGAVEYKFWRYDSGGWVLGRDWSTTSTYIWTPTYADIGVHTVQVWVRAVGSAGGYEDWRASTVTIIDGPLPQVTALVANRSLPVAVDGAAIVWTAQVTGGTAPYQYRFWRLDGDGWHSVQDWSGSNSYSWTPQSGDVGEHALQVWVRNFQSLATYEAWRGTTFTITAPLPIRVTALAADVSSPAPFGGPITWRATATGGIGPLQYKFWRYRSGSGWTLGQNYSTSNTYTWTPGPSDGGASYVVQVWVRSAGSTADYDAYGSTDWFAVTALPLPLRIAAFTTPGKVIATGASATWQATTIGGVQPVEYKFWRYHVETATWAVAQDYSPANTLSWAPASADLGTYAVQVWVRSAGSQSAYDTWAGTDFFTVVASDRP